MSRSIIIVFALLLSSPVSADTDNLWPDNWRCESQCVNADYIREQGLKYLREHRRNLGLGHEKPEGC